MLKSKINETDFKKISPAGATGSFEWAVRIWQAARGPFQESLRGGERGLRGLMANADYPGNRPLAILELPGMDELVHTYLRLSIFYMDKTMRSYLNCAKARDRVNFKAAGNQFAVQIRSGGKDPFKATDDLFVVL
jgi:hypothetical protein